jgi:iron complex outermembrane receptor protein
MRHPSLCALLIVAGGFGAWPAMAQTTGAAPSAGGIETVTVTARRRPEDLEKIPQAVTVVGPATLRANEIKTATDLQTLSPSLSVTADLGSRDDDVFTIRGQSQPFGGADPGVQTYFAEVPFGASGPGNYYDMDNIEVLRGPQGTLYGKNTTGGAILFEPKRPTDEFEGYLDTTLGNFNMREIQGALNVPVSGDLFDIRIAGDFARRDGFTKDMVFDRSGNFVRNETQDNLNYDSFRAGATLRPAPGLENYLVFDWRRTRTNGTGAELTSIASEQSLIDIAVNDFGLSQQQAQALVGAFYPELQFALANQQHLGPRRTTSSIPLFFRRDSWGLTDIAQYDLAAHLKLRNIFGYRVDKEQPSFDYDGSFLSILDIPNPRTWESNSRQTTEEFQIVGDSDVWNWIAGFYYEHDQPNGYSEVERDVFGGDNFFPPLSSTEIDSLSNGGVSQALYASATYDASAWTKGLSFTAGGRYTWDHKVAASRICIEPLFPACPFPLPDSPPFSLPTQTGSFKAPSWTLSANYQATDDTLLYLTYRRGYKSGGFNSGAGQATAFSEFKPEYLTDLEIGAKSNWTLLGVPGRTNVDAYYGWYQNVQKNDIVVLLAGGPPEPIALTFNAARATIKGLEFESFLVPSDDFQASIFYSYTDATYGKFILPSSIDLVNGLTNFLDHRGNPFGFTPKHKLGLSGRYHLPVDSRFGMPYLSASLSWQSKVWFTDLSDIEPNAFQNSYGLVNVRLDWDGVMGSGFDASLFVNNATDKTYKVGANALEHLLGTTSSIYGAPRMWGIELRYRFGEEP